MSGDKGKSASKGKMETAQAGKTTGDGKGDDGAPGRE